MNNILVFNLKGGAAKSTNSNIIASVLPGAILIEADKINKTAEDIDSDFESVQVDFVNEGSIGFDKFTNLLVEPNFTIIDVGAKMIETFHQSMINSGNYSEIDLVIIPLMDGADDFLTALDLLTNLKEQVEYKKVIFALSRWNNHEYAIEAQFDTFFNNQKRIKKDFGIDINDEDNWYVLKDSRSIKYARSNKITLKSLVEKDANVLKNMMTTEADKDKRAPITALRNIVLQSQIYWNEFIIPAISKIEKKLQQKGEK